MKQIHIPTDRASILRISIERMVYLDDEGVEGFIDLVRCNQRLNERFQAEWNYVGFRNTTKTNPQVTFHDEEKVRFIFGSYEAIYAELLGPLRQAGWSTLDMT